MAQIQKTIFISYRRTDVYTALAVYQDLTNRGYDVFFDYTSIPSGDFEQIIVSNIKARAHFVLILTPTALDRCNEPGDWLRREIEIAIAEQRNIVPLFFKGFKFGIPSVSEKLIGKLSSLNRYNGLNVHEDYFHAAMERLSGQFLSVPLDAVLHPLSTEVRKVVKEEQLAANDAKLQSPKGKLVAEKNRVTESLKLAHVATPPSKITHSNGIEFSPENRPLRVFLCNSSDDRLAVSELYEQLRAEPWIQPWLDEEELFPGQDWNLEIEKAVEAADAILVCLTKGSITKEGYIQRELRVVLDFADYKPEGTLYIIPVRLEDCEPPRRLRKWQYADYFAGSRERAFQRLLVSLKRRAEALELKVEAPAVEVPEKPPAEKKQKPVQQNSAAAPKPAPVAAPPNKFTLSNGMEFIRVPAGKFLMGSKPENKQADDDEKPQHTVDIPYDYWMARFPLTNELYNAYVKAQGSKHPVDTWEKKKDHPVVYVKWTDAMAYCQWLNSLLKAELPSGLVLCLPTEAEWEKAARGADGREFPWGNQFDKNNCNTDEGGKGGTTPVGSYSPRGDSPFGCADMSGNVWEWTHSLKNAYPYNSSDGRENETSSVRRVLRGGSFLGNVRVARCASRLDFAVGAFNRLPFGFRVVASPDLS